MKISSRGQGSRNLSDRRKEIRGSREEGGIDPWPSGEKIRGRMGKPEDSLEWWFFQFWPLRVGIWSIPFFASPQQMSLKFTSSGSVPRR